MTAAELDDLLRLAAERGEVVLYSEEDEDPCFELARSGPDGADPYPCAEEG